LVLGRAGALHPNRRSHCLFPLRKCRAGISSEVRASDEVTNLVALIYAAGSAAPPVSCNHRTRAAAPQRDQSHLGSRLWSARVECGPEVSPSPEPPSKGPCSGQLSGAISLLRRDLPGDSFFGSRKRTSRSTIGMSAVCHERTRCGQIVMSECSPKSQMRQLRRFRDEQLCMFIP
jgi:hypothetical protein